MIPYSKNNVPHHSRFIFSYVDQKGPTLTKAISVCFKSMPVSPQLKNAKDSYSEKVWYKNQTKSIIFSFMNLASSTKSGCIDFNIFW